MTIDGDGRNWDDIDGMNTRGWVRSASDMGHDGVIFKDISDDGGKGSGYGGTGTVAVAFFPEQIKSVTNKNPTSNPDIRFSLRTLPDGTQYVNVDTDQDIFENASLKDYRKIAKKYIRDNFVGKTVGEAQPAHIKGKSAKEYSGAEFYSDSRVLKSKMRAATEIPNIIDAGTFIKHSADNGSHKEATGGWDYYRVLVAVGGRMYEGIANIKNTDEGRVFYDWAQIKENTAGTTVLTSQRPRPHQPGNVSKTNIVDKDMNVNIEIDPDSKTSNRNNLVDGTPTPRGILSGAFGLVAKTAAERVKVASYKKQVDLFDRIDNLLIDKQNELRELNRSGGDAKLKAEVKAEIADLTSKLDSADRILLNLHNSKPLKDIMARERTAIEARMKGDKQQWQTDYREKAQSRTERGKRIERIERTAKDLNRWLVSPDKRHSVPEVLRSTISDLLTSLDMGWTRADGSEVSSWRSKSWQESMGKLADLMANADAFTVNNGEIDLKLKFYDNVVDIIDQVMERMIT